MRGVEARVVALGGATRRAVEAAMATGLQEVSLRALPVAVEARTESGGGESGGGASEGGSEDVGGEGGGESGGEGWRWYRAGGSESLGY